jgi:hypothetical protein
MEPKFYMVDDSAILSEGIESARQHGLSIK